jgi:hypothetical protein
VPPQSSKSQAPFIAAYREGLTQGLGARAAARLSEEQIHAGALLVAARVDEELVRMQRAGELKAVNTSYRDYRVAAAARGEKIVRYAEWLDRYKATLVRDIAANLR